MAGKEIQKIEENIGIIGIEHLAKDLIVNKSNCKFCQSKIRREAEEEYEKTKNIKKVYDFFTSHGESTTYLSVRNHIQLHYLKQEKILKLKEYADDIKEWASIKRTRQQQLMERINMLRREMCLIASETDDTLDINERRSSAMIIYKLSDSITSLEDKIEEMNKEMEPVEIIIERIKNIINIKVNNMNDAKVKQALTEVLHDLSRDVADLLVEDKG
jgi:hypothetical protein